MFGDTGGSVVNVTETGMAIAIAVGNLPAVGGYPVRIRLQLPMPAKRRLFSPDHVARGNLKKSSASAWLIAPPTPASRFLALDHIRKVSHRI